MQLSFASLFSMLFLAALSFVAATDGGSGSFEAFLSGLFEVPPLGKSAIAKLAKLRRRLCLLKESQPRSSAMRPLRLSHRHLFLTLFALSCRR